MYMSDVRSLVAELRSVADDEECARVLALRTRLCNEYCVPLGKREGLALQRGLRLGVERLRGVPPLALADQKRAVEAAVAVDWENVWNKDCASIDLAFLEETLAALTQQ